LQKALAVARQEAHLHSERVEREREENQFLKMELMRTRQEVQEMRRRIEAVVGNLAERVTI
jgi:hypothetical protein